MLVVSYFESVAILNGVGALNFENALVHRLKISRQPQEQSLVDDALDAIKKKPEGDSTDAPSHLMGFLCKRSPHSYQAGDSKKCLISNAYKL